MRIFLCSDHRLLVEALVYSLETHGHEVVGSASTLDEALRAVTEHDPDVCLLAMSTLGPDRSDVIARITPRCKILFMSARTDAALIRTVLSAGATGIVTSDQSVDDVLRALECLSLGEIPVNRDLLRAAMRTPSRSTSPDMTPLRFLTAREREALRRIALGQSTKEMARSMHVAYSTARTHVQSVLTKLGVRSRLQAVALVTRSGLTEELGQSSALDRTSLRTGASVDCGRPAPYGGGAEESNR